MRNNSKRVAQLGLCVSLAMILSYVEVLIPPIYSAVPGIKIGLPNIVVVYMIYNMGYKSAFLVSIMRVFLVALLFGNGMTLVYSMAGAVLSFLVMALMKKLDFLSCVGVSVCGGVVHNLAQILVAIILLKNSVIAYYMIVLTFTGTLSGVLIGIISAKVTTRFEKKL